MMQRIRSTKASNPSSAAHAALSRSASAARSNRALRKAALALTITLVTAATGIAVSTSAAYAAASGNGTMTASVTSVQAGQAVNHVAFTFTHNGSGQFATGSRVSLTIPDLWPMPQTSDDDDPGYVSISSESGSCNADSDDLVLSGRRIEIPHTCNAGNNFVLRYGDDGSNSDSSVTAPNTSGTYEFAVQSKNGSSAFADLAAFPTIGVWQAAQDGDGTMTATPDSVVAGSADNRFTFRFNAGSGTFSSGSQVILFVPSGWTRPQTEGSNSGNPGYTTTTAGTCTPSNPTDSGNSSGPWSITVTMACAAGTWFEINYGASTTSTTNVSAPNSPGVATFTAQSNNSVGSGDDGLDVSPTVTVTPPGPTEFALTSSAVSGPASNQATLGPITIQTQYSGSPLAVTADTVVQLASDTTGIPSFSPTQGGASITSVTIPVGQFSTSFYYGDTKAGAPTITVSGSLTSAAQQQQITAGAAKTLAFVMQPSDAFVGATMAPVAIELRDDWENPVRQSGTLVSLTTSAGSITSGVSANTDANGIATFDSLTFGSTALDATLSGSAPGPIGGESSDSFDVTVLVSNGAELTDDASDVGGSEVASVDYYYCPGYSGICTNGTPWVHIDTSTVSAGGFPVGWDDQPTNGEYRVVAVGTDHAGNVSDPSASTPVTVSNAPPESPTYFVPDASTDRVYVYGDQGTFLDSWALDADNSNPTGAAVVGSEVYVLDNGSTKQVFRYDLNGGSATASRPLTSTNSDFPFVSVEGLAIANDQMWVVGASTFEPRLYRYSLLTAFGGGGTLEASDGDALNSNNDDRAGLAIDDNYVYVLDGDDSRVYRHSRSNGSYSATSGVLYRLNGTSGSDELDATGATVMGNVLWLVDHANTHAFGYSNFTSNFTSSRNADDDFDLTADNANPQGL